MSYTITWENPANAAYDEIRIYRSTSTIDPEAPPTPIATLGGGVTTYTDVTLEQFQRYYFRVGGVVGATAYVSKEELIADTYDLVGTDPFFENVAILYRFAEAPFTSTLPANEGYASADLAERYSPPRMYSSSAVRKHYQTSMTNDLAGSNGLAYCGQSPVPSVEFGIDDAFGSITIDGWIYRTNDSGQTILFSSRKSVGDSGFEFRVDTLEALRIQVWNNLNNEVVSVGSADAAVPNNEWVHVAAVRSGTRDWELFVNGVSVGTGSQTGAGNDLYELTIFGIDGFIPPSGTYIDSLRFTVGVARYTAPFIPIAFETNVVSPVPVPASAVRGTPYLHAVGTRNSNNTAASAPFPSTYQEGDLLILQIRNDASGGVVPSAPDGSWILIGSEATSANPAAYPQLRHTLYYKFAGPSEDTSPVVPDASGTIHVRISVWRGVKKVNSPIGAIAATVDATIDTVFDAQGITTTNDRSAVLHFMIASDDTFITDTENTDLFGYEEAYFNSDTTGSDGSQLCVWGVKINAGPVQNFVGTKSLQGTEAHFVLELLGELADEVAVPATGSGALTVPSGISLGGTGLTGTFEGVGALNAPAPTIDGTGFLAPLIAEFVSSGTFAASSSIDVTPGLPAGYVDGDILILQASVGDTGQSPDDPTLDFTGDGWTYIGRARGLVIPQHIMELWWHRVSGTPVAPTVPHAGADVTTAKISCFRGCKRTGSPINAFASTYKDFGDNNFVAPQVTTTEDDCLIAGFGVVAGNGGSYQNWAAAGLESITEAYDHYADFGAPEALVGMAYGRLLTAGASGTLNSSHGSVFDQWAAATIALAPAGPISIGEAALTAPAISLGGSGTVTPNDPGFTLPAGVPDAQVWYDPENVTYSTGDEISAIPNKGTLGASYDATADLTNDPSSVIDAGWNNKRVFTMTGPLQSMQIDTLVGVRTIITIATYKDGADSTFDNLSGLVTGGSNCSIYGATNNNVLWPNNPVRAILDGVDVGSTATVLPLSKKTIGSVNATLSSTVSTLFAYFSDRSNYWEGKVGQILMWDTELTAQQIQDVCDELDAYYL